MHVRGRLSRLRLASVLPNIGFERERYCPPLNVLRTAPSRARSLVVASSTLAIYCNRSTKSASPLLFYISAHFLCACCHPGGCSSMHVARAAECVAKMLTMQLCNCRPPPAIYAPTLHCPFRKFHTPACCWGPATARCASLLCASNQTCPARHAVSTVWAPPSPTLL